MHEIKEAFDFFCRKTDGRNIIEILEIKIVIISTFLSRKTTVYVCGNTRGGVELNNKNRMQLNILHLVQIFSLY